MGEDTVRRDQAHVTVQPPAQVQCHSSGHLARACCAVKLTVTKGQERNRMALTRVRGHTLWLSCPPLQQDHCHKNRKGSNRSFDFSASMVLGRLLPAIHTALAQAWLVSCLIWSALKQYTHIQFSWAPVPENSLY